MNEFWLAYGLFAAETVTVVMAVALAVLLVVLALRRGGIQRPEHLEVTHLNKKYEQMAQVLKRAVLSRKDYRKATKADKARRKSEAHAREAGQGADGKRVFVIDFVGDIKATAVASLREEITAVLTLARAQDEVLLRLDNAGGLVHEHGLAASQLARVRQHQIPLTVAVDKVAASGGYLMACVADRILSAPFAIIGSIGVLAQLPNFHRLLEKHGVDFEQIKSGPFKRTVTMFGANTDEDRAKLKEQIEDTHQLFQDFVTRHRPGLDMAQVATGEYWHGTQALALKLIDEIATSDDYLLQASDSADIYLVRYTSRKTFSQKVISSLQQARQTLLSTGR